MHFLPPSNSLDTRNWKASRSSFLSVDFDRKSWDQTPFVLLKQSKGYIMKIEDTSFGTITIDGITYAHDVIIEAEGKVKKRKKKLSKKIYGTSHIISLDEAKFVYEKGVKSVIIGTGQYGRVELSQEGRDYFEKKGCSVVMEATPDAIKIFNKVKRSKIGLFHVTC